jgi:putative transposase
MYIGNMEYERDQHTVHLIIYHLLFCPKRKRKVLIGPIQERLHQIISEAADEHGWNILTLTIAPDHVYLCVRSNPDTFPAAIVRAMKRRSARFLRNEFPQLKRLPSLWTKAAFYSTAHEINSEVIQHYIEQQPKI